MRRFPPERIVCLTEETVETLYLLGEEFWVMFAITAAVIGAGKGVGWFLLGLPLSIFAVVMVACLPSLRAAPVQAVPAAAAGTARPARKDDYSGLFLAIAIAGGIAWVLSQVMGQ